MSLLPLARSPVHIVSLALAAACSSGCSSLDPSGTILSVVTPYRVDIVQGNVVTKEQVARVQIGMSRAQVRDILGSPLLADVFHADRWDYVFTIRRQGTEPQRRSIVALFEGERLKSLDTGGDLPAEIAFVASIDSNKSSGKAPSLALTPEQIQSLKPPPKAAQVEAPVVAPDRVYPPLESN
ncbi:MAG: outer membrane protein assembly factor BamE [Rhizobacter sp.]|jgi:outer membrane protein assembly factor BamE|nr:outer membrane protein assembly factor BamE [Rhizobacter sp.]MBP6269303.1 outer membrane protein assembly factor BamE [Rhizobacter sp.]HOX66362.1 outer membrane protein assembly factor BamE [Burkholderiaceae bacterium]